MPSNALFLTLLTITGIEALPLTDPFVSCLRNSTCGLLFTIGGTTGSQDTPITLFPPTPTFEPIIGSTRPIWIPSFSIPPTRPTTRYTNTGDPVSAFLQARQPSTAAVTEVGELQATMIHDSARHESTPTTMSLRTVLVGSRGFEVGNGVEAHGDFDETSTLDARGERGDTSTPVRARELGTFGGGDGVPPLDVGDLDSIGGGDGVQSKLKRHVFSGDDEIPLELANQMGTIGCSNSVSPIVARDPGSVGGCNGIPPQLAEDSGSG